MNNLKPLSAPHFQCSVVIKIPLVRLIVNILNALWNRLQTASFIIIISWPIWLPEIIVNCQPVKKKQQDITMEPFKKEDLSSKQKGLVRMRSIMDAGMGVLWLAMGAFMIFPNEIAPNLAYTVNDKKFQIFGVVCAIYGLFRIYRAVRKNYFREL